MRTRVSSRTIWTAAGALLLALVLETPAHGQFDLGVILATLTELNQTMSVTVGGPLAATAATTATDGRVPTANHVPDACDPTGAFLR